MILFNTIPEETRRVCKESAREAVAKVDPKDLHDAYVESIKEVSIARALYENSKIPAADSTGTLEKRIEDLYKKTLIKLEKRIEDLYKKTLIKEGLGNRLTELAAKNREFCGGPSKPLTLPVTETPFPTSCTGQIVRREQPRPQPTPPAAEENRPQRLGNVVITIKTQEGRQPTPSAAGGSRPLTSNLSELIAAKRERRKELAEREKDIRERMAAHQKKSNDIQAQEARLNELQATLDDLRRDLQGKLSSLQ